MCFLILLSIFSLSLAEKPFNIDISGVAGVESLGYNVIYGDQDITVMNQVVGEVEKNLMKKKFNLNEAIKPLPSQDVKCLMSVDKYCSKDMGHIKSVLIEALKDECSKCSSDDKEKAGQVIAAMMAHDHVAWKLFLTRSTLLTMPRKSPTKEKTKILKYKYIGEPETVEPSKNRFIMDGVKVRVKRYVTEVIE